MLLPCIKPTKLIDEATRRAVRFEREIFEKLGVDANQQQPLYSLNKQSQQSINCTLY